MKKVLLLIAWAAAASVGAQTAEPAKEPTAAQNQGAQAPAKSAVARKSRRMEDARHCLERPSNIEIIKCAEAYL